MIKRKGAGVRVVERGGHRIEDEGRERGRSTATADAMASG